MSNTIPELPADRLARHQRLRDFATANGRALLLGERVSPGDEYIFLGKYELKIFVCEELSSFTKSIRPTSIFSAFHHISKCYKVAPLPRPNEITIMEKLQLIQDEITSLKIIIQRQSRG